MEVENLSLPATNRFATQYYDGMDEVQKFFHYDYQNPSHYKDRLGELAVRDFARNELADHIAQFMEQFPSSHKVVDSIHKLRNHQSVVIIGGQQAGILTGPLYSIHKAISIIVLAKQKEIELGVPVVPLFWIAGEDHDYLEVNHVYIEHNNQLQKWVYPGKNINKSMVTDCELNQDTCLAWIKELVETFGETEYTKPLLHLAEKAVFHSKTYVDLFAYFIMELFKEHGLLLVDSGNQEFRKLQKSIFAEQIKKAVGINSAVKEQQTEIVRSDFPITIDMSEQAANLFYYDKENYERILLEFDHHTNLFSGKNGLIQFSMEEMLKLAEEEPEKLSNNVVTRPLMQESLFPTLAFIAGPGEIAYWAELRQAFELFGMKMPPIVPRLNITLLERDLEALLKEHQLELQHVLSSGIENEKNAFLSSVKDKSFEELFVETREVLLQQYKRLEGSLAEEYRGLLPLLKKNEGIILEQIGFMEKKIDDVIISKHDVALRKFDKIAASLRPNNGPQERMWNVLYFLNKYGIRFVDELANLPLEFDGNHKVVRL